MRCKNGISAFFTGGDGDRFYENLEEKHKRVAVAAEERSNDCKR